jgi:alkylation response protein AidB-like acyl-CoA dehydrogenase
VAIGITDDHEALRRAVRRFVDDQISPTVVRAASEAPDALPPFWDQLVDLGWLTLHVPEASGGAGFGLVDLAVVVEELGRACAPGPAVATAAASHVVGRAVGPVAIAVDGPAIRFVEYSNPRQSLDPTRPVVDDGVPVADLGDETAFDRAAIVFAVEAIGLAQWCVETAAAYAKDRVQFGRPIGQFQGVKHRCADMLARTELARAAVWDACRAGDAARTESDDNGADLALATACALAFDAAFECAKDCIQVLGGIGFTWEHDAHFYLRRAMSLRAMFGGGHRWRVRAARAAATGGRRRLAVDLPVEAEALREELREFLAEVKELPRPDQRERLVAGGYLTPSWPKPWGRDADALELMVIEEEFRAAKVARPSIMVGAWALPNLIVYGTTEQQQRWILPTLRGEITWCQLFSEPGAGSDLAALTTRAERVDGGWRINGQKVWSSMAHTADWGILLARTDPGAAKHDGISCFMLDMHSPGVDARPLRELTGAAMFNEVFFDDVFVPDDCLVGVEHDGWRCARTTLANERVYMGGSNTIGGGVIGVLRLLETLGLADDSYQLDQAGALVVTGHALAVLGYRLTLSALAGADPSGSEAAVRKLLGVQHDQRVQEVGVELCGPIASIADGDAATWVGSFLFNRCLSIAGGTTEIQKNVIAERLLGLPRDP